jgi:hypothetical protein
MLAMIPTLRQLVCQVGGGVKCDTGSTMAGATRLVARARGTILDGSVHFLGEFSAMAGAFTLGLVLNFGSLAYVPDYYDERRPLHVATPAGSEPPTSPTLLGLLGADLEVLA